MNPTTEQINATSLASSGCSMKLIAFAGAGKTSTLILIARALQTQNKRGLYLAFNKDIANEARSKLPNNVAASTFHSLAYRNSPSWLTAKLGVASLSAKEFTERFQLSPMRVSSYEQPKKSMKHMHIKKVITGFHQMKIIDEGLKVFMNTSSRQPAERHLRAALDDMFNEVTNNDKNFLTARLFVIMKNIWLDYTDPNGKIGLGNNHGVYLKMWALSEPKLDTDFILFDEAQDADPIIIGVLLKQDCPVIYVGDSHQQIYGWRGAIDIMKNLNVPARYLTQSFRFGDNLAKYNQPILKYLGEENIFKGLKGDETEIDEVTLQPDDINVMLCRTNMGALEVMINYAAKGLYALPVNINLKATMNMLDSLKQFEDNPASQKNHPILKGFNDFKELTTYNEEFYGDQSIAPFLKIYSEYEYADIQRTLTRCSNLKNQEKWDFQVTTAHRAKGLEWDNVMLHSDFNDQFFGKEKEYKDANDEEYRLLYVAMTRARKKLYSANVVNILSLLKKKR